MIVNKLGDVLFIYNSSFLPLCCAEFRLRPDDITGNCFHGTLADYDETLKHVRPVVYNELVNRLGERLLIEYLKVLLTR